MGKVIALEHEEQTAYFQWVDMVALQNPIYKNIYAIPNQGRRSFDGKWGARRKREGLRSGVPDICGAIPNKLYHGFYIEAKRKGNKPTANQIDWLRRLRNAGYAIAVCFSADEMINFTVNYMCDYDFSNPTEAS